MLGLTTGQDCTLIVMHCMFIPSAIDYLYIIVNGTVSFCWQKLEAWAKCSVNGTSLEVKCRPLGDLIEGIDCVGSTGNYWPNQGRVLGCASAVVPALKINPSLRI